MCPQLALLLKMKYNILSVGTCRVNRKGWPKDILKMTETNSEKGDFIITYDDINQVSCMQWRDSKIVNLVSTLNDSSHSTCQRWEGNRIVQLSVPSDYNQYSSKMFGVDKGDQARVHFGGFANRSHFHKWYIKVYMAILDCALLNANNAWNMSCDLIQGRKHLKRHEFMWSVCQQMLDYVDSNYVSISVPVARHAACAMVADGSHVPQSNNKNRERRRCVVCQLEVNICEEVNESGLRNAAVGKCGSPGCIIAAHTTVQTIGHRKIGTFPQFVGLTCFQIAHHPTTVGLWKQTTCGYTTCQSHPIIKRLKEMHDKTPTIRRVRRRFDEIIGEDLSNIEAV